MADKIVSIPLSQLFSDPKWNARFSLDSGSGGAHEDQEQSLESLAQSIAQSGQDTPIIVRPNPFASKDKYPFHVVCGHRRVAAIAMNAEKSKTKLTDATVRAEIREMSEIEARELNLRENSARDNITPPDYVFGIRKLRSENEKMTQEAIAAILGKTQSYVSKLYKIGSKVKPAVADEWRKNPNAATIPQMLVIAELPTAEQEAAWSKFYTAANAAATSDGDGEGGGVAAPIDRYKERGAKLAAKIGELAFTGIVEANFTAEAVMYALGIREGAISDKECAALVKHMVKAHDAAYAEAEKADAEAAEAEAAKEEARAAKEEERAAKAAEKAKAAKEAAKAASKSNGAKGKKGGAQTSAAN